MSEPAPEAEQDHAGVIIPPPLIFVAVLALGLAIDLLADGPGLGLPDVPRYVAGAALFVIGMALALTASAGFRVAGTDVRPWKASTALVTSGLYRYTRNPMYLGLTLVYAGLSLFADSVIALILIVPLLVIITYSVIKREEHYLAVKFGEEYRRYKSKVRRWF